MAETAGSQEGKVVAAATTKTKIVPTLEGRGTREARPLTVAPSPGRDHRILALHRDKLGSPTPLTKDPARRDQSKLCEYHQDHGHLTSECYQLKRQIEALIQDGKLKEYILRTIGTAAAHGGRPRQGKKGPATLTVTDRAANEEPESSQLHVVGAILGGPEFGDSAT